MAQELSEQLEADRAKLKAELQGMKDANEHVLSQRDDALKVVLHLRKLIDGQAHLLEDIVHTLPQDVALVTEEVDTQAEPSLKPALDRLAVPDPHDRSSSAMSNREKLEGADVTPEMEDKFFDSARNSGFNNGFPRGLNRAKRYSLASISDVADKSLKEKTSAISEIIRNISEQCARAVDTLHLVDEEYEALSRDDVSEAVGPSIMGDDDIGSTEVQDDETRSEGMSARRNSDVSERSVVTGPSPDLHNRSSTSFSNFSNTNISRHSAYTDATSVGGDAKAVNEEEEAEQDDAVGAMVSSKAQTGGSIAKHPDSNKTRKSGKAHGRPVSKVPVVEDVDSDEEGGKMVSENVRLSLACVGGAGSDC